MTATYPYPFPPERPTPAPAPAPAVPFVPTIREPSGDDPFQRLFDQRTVFLRGRLDEAAATRLAAELMTLDGMSGRDLQVLINSPGGPLADVLPVLDTMALLRSTVHTTCIGQALGTAAAVLACGSGRRRASPSASLSVRCADPVSIEGPPADVERHVEQLQRARATVRDALARATGRPPAQVERDLDQGSPLEPAAAVEYGLIDEVALSNFG